MLILLAALQAEPQVSPDVALNISREVYSSCLQKEAVKLEPSGEGASDIASVAVSRCEWLLPVVYDDALAVFRARPEVKNFEASGKPYVNYGEQKPSLLENFRSAGRTRTMAFVMDARAARNKKK